MRVQDKFSFIRYSNCWEDSKILLKALKISEGEVGLSVASGGDNTLALLIANPRRIYAFDINKTQLYLMKLKMAAIAMLGYDEVLGFFGLKESRHRLRTFESLKESLDAETYRYFDQRRELIEAGIIHSGKFERYFQIFRKYVCPLFCRKERLNEFCNLSSQSEQWTFYHKYINNLRFRLIFRLFFGVKILGGLGRDKSFFKHVKEKKSTGGDIKKRFEFGISHSVNLTNPYLSYILRGNFGRSSLPLYLRKNYFYTIKERLNRISFVHSSLLEIPDEECFDFFNLSDIFEYVSEEDFQKNIKKLETISGKGARFALWNMQNRRYLPVTSFIQKRNESRALFCQNQSYFYRDFFLYKKR